MWRVGSLLVALLLVATPTRAATLYSFSGQIAHVGSATSPVFDIAIGDEFFGYLLYAVPDPAPPGPPGFSVGNPAGISWHFLWSVNGLTFSSASPAGSTTASSTGFRFEDIVPIGPAGTPTVVFWDDATYLLDFASPLTSWNIDPNQFVSGWVGASGFGPGFFPSYSVGGRITSLQVLEVSEPSSTLLLLSGTALLAGRRITQRLARARGHASRQSTQIPR